MVSDLHANIIVNLGHARASDVRAVIDKVVKRVREDSGRTLEPEIGFVGEF